MKHLLLLFITLLSVSTLLTAQSDICQNLYVWEFSDENKKRTPITKMLTNEVEEALTSTACIVLQRRNYARLSEQIDTESAIQSLENVAKPLNDELELIKAKAVLFGQVSQDFSGNIFIRVSFENLENKQILLSSSMTLVGEEAYNLSKRKDKITAFVMSCVGQKVVSGDETFFWEQTKQLNTVEGYQSYLTKYPNGKYKSEANTILADEAEWKGIMELNNKGKQIRFLQKYLTSNQTQHLSEAKELLGELLWQKKRLAEYMQLLPDGKYATDETIWKHGDVPLYLKYFPDGKYSSRSDAALWKGILNANENPTYFDLKKNIDAYMAYFPNGKFNLQIEDLLLSRVSSVREVNFEEAVKFYFQYFAEGQRVAKMEELLWAKVTSSNAKEVFAEREVQKACEYYLKYFPNGKYAKAAKAKMGS